MLVLYYLIINCMISRREFHVCTVLFQVCEINNMNLQTERKFGYDKNVFHIEIVPLLLSALQNYVINNGCNYLSMLRLTYFQCGGLCTLHHLLMMTIRGSQWLQNILAVAPLLKVNYQKSLPCCHNCPIFSNVLKLREIDQHILSKFSVLNSKWFGNSISPSCSFETSRDLAIIHVM